LPVGDELEAPDPDEAAASVRRIAAALCRAHPPPRECGKTRAATVASEVSLFLDSRIEIHASALLLSRRALLR
jgi:hypothetical protein